MVYLIADETIIAYLIWKGSYNLAFAERTISFIIAYLIWKGSYNGREFP